MADGLGGVMNTPVRAIRVPDYLWDAAKSAAEYEELTISDVVRDMLVQYVRLIDEERANAV